VTGTTLAIVWPSISTISRPNDMAPQGDQPPRSTQFL
jgi:hypothetical protein